MDDLPSVLTKRIGDYLREAGILTRSQLLVALYDQRRTGLPLGEILVLRGWVQPQIVNKLLHQQMRSRLHYYLALETARVHAAEGQSSPEGQSDSEGPNNAEAASDAVASSPNTDRPPDLETFVVQDFS